MSAVEAESECIRDISNMLPKWFKHTRSIKCGRASKIICIDQLYGWRGFDTGYYGSEELEDAPDFLDEVKTLPTQNEIKNDQLEVLRKEAKERLKKERETHPNFNILTDHAPTPDFSVTYIETSYNTDHESVSKSEKKNVTTFIDEGGKIATDETVSSENNVSDFGEPMENSGTNVTYTIEKNEDNNDFLLLAGEDRVSSSEQCKSILGLKLDGTIIVEKSHEAEGNMVIQAQKEWKEQRDASVLDHESIDEIAKNTSSQREKNEALDVARNQIMQTANSTSIHHEDGISPQPTNQKVFGYPASLQATFDLSCIDKIDSSVGGKSEALNPRASQVSPSFLLEQIDSGTTRLNTSRLNDRTTVSFKTPKQHMRTVAERVIVGKQPAVATPLFKKRSIAGASRGTSTPVKESAYYVCPRYVAHHAVLASYKDSSLEHLKFSLILLEKQCFSHATQTGSGTPLLLHSRIIPEDASTPLRRPSPCSAHVSCELTTGKSSTPSRIPIPTSALAAISQYGTSPLSRRSTLVDYELTPQSHVLNRRHTPRQECSGAKLEDQSTNSTCSVAQIPLSRFAFEHLKNGGTPRPTSSTEKKWKGITGDNSLLSIPRTPIAKTDISQMLVDNVMRSGPAYRRRPHPSKLLLPIGKLRFEKSAENSNLSPKYVSPATKLAKDSAFSTQEEMNTQLVVIDSFDDDTVEKLAEDTANLSIVEQQNILSDEPEIIFDTTTNEYRKQREIPVFDTGNYFGQRRILSMLNDSNVSVNTPGKVEDSVVKMNPSFSDDSHNPSDDTSISPVHIIAAKDENKHAAVLCARKIVHCEEAEQGLRRSTRNRVAPIRRWLGEKPVYRRDQQGTYELVRVEEAIVKDPLFVKYNTVDMAEVLERQKREQRQHARARKLRKFDRARRDYGEEDVKISE
uniref:PEHE domain-containing protein n=1 Tax=Loa loa TaxID=7209 RepID=A0A1I7W5E8_LOALO